MGQVSFGFSDFLDTRSSSVVLRKATQSESFEKKEILEESSHVPNNLSTLVAISTGVQFSPTCRGITPSPRRLILPRNYLYPSSPSNTFQKQRNKIETYHPKIPAPHLAPSLVDLSHSASTLAPAAPTVPHALPCRHLHLPSSARTSRRRRGWRPRRRWAKEVRERCARSWCRRAPWWRRRWRSQAAAVNHASELMTEEWGCCVRLRYWKKARENVSRMGMWEGGSGGRSTFVGGHGEEGFWVGEWEMEKGNTQVRARGLFS